MPLRAWRFKSSRRHQKLLKVKIKMTYVFSDHKLIPEDIQNWIWQQIEYPKTSTILGSMTLLTLDTINIIVNKRYDENIIVNKKYAEY
jgi:hypothetical protein